MSVMRFPNASHPVNSWVFGGLVAGSAIFSIAALVVLHRPWDLARFTRPFFTMLICLYLGLTLEAFAQYYSIKPAGESTILRTVVATMSFQGVALLFLWRFVREHQVTWRDAFGFSLNSKIAVMLGVLITCCFIPVGEGLQIVSAKIMSSIGVKPELQPAVQALKSTVTWVDRLTLGVVAIVVAPVAEETLFRGVLYVAVKQAGFPRLALWGVSLVFAAVHLNFATLLPLFVLAVTLTLLYEKTGNLLAPIVAHSFFNLYNFVKFFLFETQLGPSS